MDHDLDCTVDQLVKERGGVWTRNCRYRYLRWLRVEIGREKLWMDRLFVG